MIHKYHEHEETSEAIPFRTQWNQFFFIPSFEAIIRLLVDTSESSRLIWPNESSGLYSISPVVSP